MTERSEHLQLIATVIADYRQGEIDPRTPDFIDLWLQQFPKDIQDPLLEALANVMSKTYVSRDTFRNFLKNLASTNKLTRGTDPGAYWRRANLLRIQGGGNSQNEILSMFDGVLQETHGFDLSQTGELDGDFIYLDDCIGTGNRLRNDVCTWLKGDTPQSINLHVITPILFTGSWWVDQKIKEAADENGKTVVIKKWFLEGFKMENRRRYRNRSDVLWPTSGLDDAAVREYVANLTELGYPPCFRAPGNQGNSTIFRNDQQRMLLENEFLKRGCEIREEQTNLPQRFRPLGYSNLDTFGFGSMFVTYRNCPNNCPLVFWAEQDGCPVLFPRKTNTDSFNE